MVMDVVVVSGSQRAMTTHNRSDRFDRPANQHDDGGSGSEEMLDTPYTERIADI
jgi:hypothetical protein